MNKSFAALAINFVGFQLLWFVAVYGGAHGWGWAAWLVLVAMQAGVWALNRAWRADLALLAAGAVACVLFEPLWLCLLYTSPSPRDLSTSRMPSSA